MIRHLLLDLDNTLYPASSGMDEGITRRMLAFVAEHLGVSLEEGTRLRAAGLPSYGTTLEWLTVEHNLKDQKRYFEFVHPESEIGELEKDEKLRPYLLSLGLPLTLLTNAPAAHAERLLEFFDIKDIFVGIYDLECNKGVGKPHPDSFRSAIAPSGFTVEETVFVDDHPKYVKGYKAIGGKAVIVDETGRYRDLADAEGYGHIRNIYGLAQFLTAFADLAITI